MHTEADITTAHILTFGPDTTESNSSLCVGLSICSPPQSKRADSEYPIRKARWLNHFSPPWEFASSTEHDGTQGGLPFMPEIKLRVKKQRDPRLAEIFKPGKWVQIPKAIQKAMMSNSVGLSKNEIQVVIALALKTWGYQKYSDRISRSQISVLTELDVSAVSRTLKLLRTRHIIIPCKDYSWKKMRPYEWRIEDDTSKWLTRKAISDKTSRGMNHTRNHGINSHQKQEIIHTTTIDHQKKEAFIERTHKTEKPIKESCYVPIENRKARY